MRGLKVGYRKWKAGHVKKRAEVNRLNSLYGRAEEAWRAGQLKRAFRLFLIVAKAGFIPAFEILANFYDNGWGTRTDLDTALLWYRRAYRYGSYIAANNIACILRDSGKVSEALEWFKRAVRLGDADANLNIAKVYLSIRHEPTKAKRYLIRTRRGKFVTDGSREEADRLLTKIKKRCGRGRPLHQ